MKSRPCTKLIGDGGEGFKNRIIYKYFACLSFRLIDKTAEPIGPTFCVIPHMTPGKDYGSSKLEKLEFLYF